MFWVGFVNNPADTTFEDFCPPHFQERSYVIVVLARNITNAIILIIILV
jgi:hypothetical protein